MRKGDRTEEAVAGCLSKWAEKMLYLCGFWRFANAYLAKHRKVKIMIDNRNISIVQDSDGKYIVIINDRKLRGDSKDDWKIVEEYLKGFIWDHYEIIDTAEAVYIGTEFPSEYSGSKSRLALKGARRKAKALAAQGIPEMIRFAENPRWEENRENKHRKDAKYGWYRYDVRFGIPVYAERTKYIERYNVFKAILLVKHAEDDKKYLHDLITIKKETSSPPEYINSTVR